MDLSKEDILNHDLLIAKLEVYGFSAKSLSGIRNYLNKRLQKRNDNCDFSLWKEIFSEKCCLLENVITWLLDEMPSNMNLSFKMAQFFLPSAKKHIVLGITIDSRLTFYSHLKQLWKKVANKPNALTRISPYLSYNQRRLIYISFFTGQLSYCPLTWTFCSRQSNHLINKLQEWALRVTYNYHDSSFS